MEGIGSFADAVQQIGQYSEAFQGRGQAFSVEILIVRANADAHSVYEFLSAMD